MIFRTFRIAALIFISSTLCYGKEDPLFMGLIIKDNDATIDTFLNKIEAIDYDKKAIHLQLDILNQNPTIIEHVKNWSKDHTGEYLSIKSHTTRAPLDTIKNSYLLRNDVKWIFITSSEVFLKPFTLRSLISKNLPITTPLLRPTPDASTRFRNFYLSATENGYYKENSGYDAIADRQKIGTFQADCVHTAYLIDAAQAQKLNFYDGSAWDFVAFSNTARKNRISQFISNEKEYGFFLLSNTEAYDTLSPPQLSRDISREEVEKFSKDYCCNDAALKEYQASLPIQNYSLYAVEDHLFWVDEKWDWVKSHYIKKGLTWEPHIQKLFETYVKKGDTAVDIGGHIGTHTIALSELVGPSGSVHTFEPQTKLFTELLVNTSINGCKNVILHRAALGSNEGIAYIAHPCATNEGMAKISSSGEKVDLKILDSFNLSNISLIKIDVEGYEIEALKGAKETIKRNKPVIIVEVFGGPEQEEKLNFIRSLGYEISHLGGEDYLCIPTSVSSSDTKALSTAFFQKI